MYHKAWDGTAWAAVSHGLGASRLACSPVRRPLRRGGSNRLDIFGLGTRRRAVSQGVGRSNAWRPSRSDWESLGGNFTSPPVAVAWGSNRLDIFGRGTDGALYHKAWNGSAWLPSLTNWESLGGDLRAP